MRDDQTFCDSSVEKTMIFVTCGRLQTRFFGLRKNDSHTNSIFEKSLIIDLSFNFIYVWNCMKSV